MFNFYDKSVSVALDLTKYDTTKDDQLQTSIALFKGVINQTACHFRAAHRVIGEYDEDIEDPYFIWKVQRYYNLYNFTDSYEILDNTKPLELLFDDYVFVVGTYPYPIKISHTYSYSYSNFLLEGIPSYPEIQSRTYINPTMETVEFFPCGQANIDMQVFQENIVKGEYVFNISSLNNIKTVKCVTQLNMITIAFIGNVRNVQGNNMTYVSMIYNDYSDLNFTKCHWEDMQCPQDIECDPFTAEINTGSLYNFSRDGCRPYCGRCKTGFKCNTQGKCVTEQVLSQRQGSNNMMILFIFILIIFII